MTDDSTIYEFGDEAYRLTAGDEPPYLLTLTDAATDGEWTIAFSDYHSRGDDTIGLHANVPGIPEDILTGVFAADDEANVDETLPPRLLRRIKQVCDDE